MNTDSDTPPSRGLTGGLGTTLLICGLLLVAGGAALLLIFGTEPGAERETAVRETAMLVEVTEPEAGTFRPTIEAMGVVRPAREITLRARVGGRVVDLSEDFEPGGYPDEGETLLRIDDADYQNALEQRESELDQAIADLEMERGQQAKARQDYQDLGRDLSPEREALVLREPQLRSAEAQVKSARSALEQARLELERTTITAPFDAQVLTREVNLGSEVAPGDPLAQLAGLDTYWVEATVPVEKLRWLSFTEDENGRGSPVQVRNRTAWPGSLHRQGHLYRLIGELEANTRMARVLVAVDDPLAREEESLGVPPLMIGAFVESRIRGRPIEGVSRISREYIRQDDTVWLMEDGQLAISPVDILFRDAEHAYIRDGLDAGDRVVTTDLATVEEGVGLRVRENGGSAAGAGNAAAEATGDSQAR